MFSKSMNPDLINGGRHFGSRFHGLKPDQLSWFFPDFVAKIGFVIAECVSREMVTNFQSKWQ